VAKMPNDDWRKRDAEFQEPRLSRNLALVEVLRRIGQRHDAAPGEVAIAWTLRNPAVTGAVVGGRNPRQVEGTIGAADLTLTDADLEEIGRFLRERP
jgi:aryl-alcohol dehydrogenase-like predicted oxidoreductase